MYVFIGGKVNAISVLGHLVAGITPEGVKYGFGGDRASSALFGPESEERLIKLIERLKGDVYPDRHELDALLNMQVPDEKIANVGEMTRDQVEVLRSYLNLRKPREALEVIRPTLEKLHHDLRESFSVEDIVSKVGQESWSLDEDPFWSRHRS